MTNISRSDRIKGAILGALVGDALGVGPHWYYDLEELKDTYGPWIDDYVAEKPGRFHDGLQAGENSQTGRISIMLLESVTECGGYDEDDFTRRLDGLLATLDGTPQAGHFTDVAIRDLWQARHAGIPWSEASGPADTPDAAIRAPILATRYVDDFGLAVKNVISNVQLTHRDPFIVGQSVTFGLIVGALADGIPLSQVSSVIPERVKEEDIKLSAPLPWVDKQKVDKMGAVPTHAKFYASLAQPAWAYAAAHDPAIQIEPASAACRMFGWACTMGFMLPAVYYFAARFEDDFEMAVLSAINGGGHNMARASLTGAVSGAQVGLSGIPERFITGLANHDHLLDLVGRVADATEST